MIPNDREVHVEELPVARRPTTFTDYLVNAGIWTANLVHWAAFGDFSFGPIVDETFEVII